MLVREGIFSHIINLILKLKLLKVNSNFRFFPGISHKTFNLLTLSHV